MELSGYSLTSVQILQLWLSEVIPLELKHIQRDDSPEGVFINASAFDPNIHKPWVEPIPEIIEVVEIAGLQEPIAADPPKKSSKKKVIADDLERT